MPPECIENMENIHLTHLPGELITHSNGPSMSATSGCRAIWVRPSQLTIFTADELQIVDKTQKHC